VRVTDYKTGARPKELESIVIDGGRELQRVLYALAIVGSLIGGETAAKVLKSLPPDLFKHKSWDFLADSFLTVATTMRLPQLVASAKRPAGTADDD